MSTVLATRNAFGYLRVSSPEQARDQHNSLETQQARFLSYCEGSQLAPVSIFVDAVTGRRDDRRAYREMLELVRRKEADVVVVQYLDRFGRNPKEILQRYWELEELGVSVVATDEDIEEELVLLVKAGIAGAESRRNSERVRANMTRAVQKGVHAGRPPYGLKPIREIRDGKAVVVKWERDAIEAPIVREMYRLSMEENLGYKGIADRLNEGGYRNREGRPFVSYTIQKVLSNEAIRGTLVYGKKPRKGNPKEELVRVEGFFPEIVSEAEWNQLQERLAIRREHARGHTHRSSYLLSGIARCGYCGGPMVGRAGAKRKGRQYRNYWCSWAMRSKALCAYYNGHSGGKLENAVLAHLEQYSDPVRVREILAVKTKEEVTRHQGELSGIERRLTFIERDFTKNLDLLKRGVINEEEFKKANEARRDERTSLADRRQALVEWLGREADRAANVETIPLEIKSFLEDFREMDIHRQKVHLQRILKAVHVWKGGRVELEFRV
jgi:site-specific DNA recombinase